MTGIAKYSRVGYVNLDRKVDRLLAAFLSKMPTEDVGYLPVRWKYFSQDSFLEQYGHLGTTLIARAAGSHTVVCRGVKAIRFWTEREHKALVQVSDAIANELRNTKLIEVQDIPPGVSRKASGFSYRAVVDSEAKAKIIALVFRKLFDV